MRLQTHATVSQRWMLGIWHAESLTDFASLLEDNDAELVLPLLLGQLHDPDGRRQSGRSSSDDADIDLVRDALDFGEVEGVDIVRHFIDRSGQTSSSRRGEGAVDYGCSPEV